MPEFIDCLPLVVGCHLHQTERIQTEIEIDLLGLQLLMTGDLPTKLLLDLRIPLTRSVPLPDDNSGCMQQGDAEVAIAGLAIEIACAVSLR